MKTMQHVLIAVTLAEAALTFAGSAHGAMRSADPLQPAVPSAQSTLSYTHVSLGNVSRIS
ncbi:hypothetical protein AB0M94_36025 [Streptomyces xanthochromogenes]|uniref:hypothetical protein n=1 Tax=Streptomyces xanthochromogenes TaxID=67384 RepID=UPI00343C701A